MERCSEAKIDKNTIDASEKIADGCDICKQTASAPRTFKLTVKTPELRFNCRVQADTMFIHGLPVLHMVEEATQFCAVSFLRSQTTKDISNKIQHMWSLVCLGSPSYLVVDQETAYISKEMNESSAVHGIQLHEALIERPGAIRKVERYHALLRLACEKIRADSGKQISNQECLELSVFAINCTVRPERLCAAFPALGADSRPARMTPARRQLKRARVVDLAMK